MKTLILFNKSPLKVTDGGTMAAHSLTDVIVNQSEFTVIAPFSTHKHPVNAKDFPKKWKEKAVLESIQADTRLRPTGFIKSMADGSSYHMQRVRDSDTRHQVLSLISKYRPDVVVLDGLFGLAYAEIVKSAFDIPVLYRSHNVEHLIWKELAEKEKNPLKKTTLTILANRLKAEEFDMLRFVDGIFFISAEDSGKIMEKGSGMMKPYEVLFPSFDESFFNRKFIPSAETEPLKLFHLGAMDWAPNLEAVTHFVEVIWPEIRKAYGDRVTFHAAGVRMPESLLNRKIPGVTFSGKVPDFMEFANTHHLMAVPLISGSGIRMKIAEAMVSGIPVIASTHAIGGIPAQKNKEFLQADSAKEWIKQLGDILSGKTDLHKLAQAGRTKAQALFSEEAANAVVKTLFEKIKRD
ncbi:MAG: glycosyltransferase [Flavobacteriales bacterium]|nr:glycosyltransferase [Flavobacteriales bacterium]